MKRSTLLQLILCMVLLMLIGFATYEKIASVHAEKDVRAIYMSTIEPKGTGHIAKHPFPDEKPPPGGGYILHAPDANGEWIAGTYRFEPGMIVAYKGETIQLHIWGVNGASHRSKIEGYDIDFTVEKGKLTVVEFEANQSGIFTIICYDHLPAMQSQLLVLPND